LKLALVTPSYPPPFENLTCLLYLNNRPQAHHGHGLRHQAIAIAALRKRELGRQTQDAATTHLRPMNTNCCKQDVTEKGP
jgi:hypothetical protein